jgi:hypothetical protein
MSKLKSIISILAIIGIIMGIIQLVEIVFGAIVMFYLALQ